MTTTTNPWNKPTALEAAALINAALGDKGKILLDRTGLEYDVILFASNVTPEDAHAIVIKLPHFRPVFTGPYCGDVISNGYVQSCA